LNFEAALSEKETEQIVDYENLNGFGMAASNKIG